MPGTALVIVAKNKQKWVRQNKRISTCPGIYFYLAFLFTQETKHYLNLSLVHSRDKWATKMVETGCHLVKSSMKIAYISKNLPKPQSHLVLQSNPEQELVHNKNQQEPEITTQERNTDSYYRLLVFSIGTNFLFKAGALSSPSPDG